MQPGTTFYFKAWAALFTSIGCFMNGGAIAYTGPALPNLMNDGAKDLYGNDISVSFQSASWIGELTISES